MKKTSIILSVILILLLSLATGTMTSGTTLEDLDRQKEEQEQKAKQLEQELSSLRSKESEQKAHLASIEEENEVVRMRMDASNDILDSLMVSIGELNLQIETLNYELEELDLSIAIKENEMNKTLLELQRIEKDKEILHAQAKERIRVMYEYGDSGFLEVMLESKDLMDMFSRMEYINRLVDADNELFNNLDQYEENIVGKETELEVHEQTLQQMSSTLEEEKLNLDDLVVSKNLEVEYANELRDIQEATRIALKEQELETEEILDEIEDNQDAIDAELQRVEDEMARIVAMELALLAGDDGITAEGSILWPVPGWSRISSKFGPRLHPIQNVWKPHNGIDIPAYSGTPIVAAAGGKVVIAQYSSGYGNYCVIAHAHGYSSLYGHASKLKVSVGDYVEAGETVALVGTTGWSTGNHLHFGFKKNDTWLNPVDYIVNR